MTSSYMEYGGESYGWHFGLWSDETATLPDAVAHATAHLVEGLPLREGMRVLDLGCGVGGLGLYLARAANVKVTGVTVNAAHCELARGLAREHGVESSLDFRCDDFNTMEFEPGAYDYILHHESFCYVSDASTYFERVREALVPGGRWRALDGVLADEGPVDDEDSRRRDEATQKGWKIAPLRRPEAIAEAARAGGLTWSATEDVTAAVAPTARMFVAMAQAVHQGQVPPGTLPTDPHELQVKLDHIGAGEAFSEGLLAGQFGYVRMTAIRGGAQEGER